MPQYGCRSCCPRSLSPFSGCLQEVPTKGRGHLAGVGGWGQTRLRQEPASQTAACGQQPGSRCPRHRAQPGGSRWAALPPGSAQPSSPPQKGAFCSPGICTPRDGQAHAGSTKGPRTPRGWLHPLMDIPKRTAGSVGQPCHPRTGLPGTAAVTHGEGNAA